MRAPQFFLTSFQWSFCSTLHSKLPPQLVSINSPQPNNELSEWPNLIFLHTSWVDPLRVSVVLYTYSSLFLLNTLSLHIFLSVIPRTRLDAGKWEGWVRAPEWGSDVTPLPWFGNKIHTRMISSQDTVGMIYGGFRVLFIWHLKGRPYFSKGGWGPPHPSPVTFHPKSLLRWFMEVLGSTDTSKGVHILVRVDEDLLIPLPPPYTSIKFYFISLFF